MNENIYKVGFTKTKIIEKDGNFGVILINQEYKGFSKNELLTPCNTFEEMQAKLDDYAKIKKLKQI